MTGADSDGAPMMERRTFLTSLAAVLMATPGAAEQVGGVWRVGVLAAQSRSAASYRIEAFKQGLLELGYVEM
jgi:hypothetical protein